MSEPEPKPRLPFRVRKRPHEILGSLDHRTWEVPKSRWIQRQSWLEFPFLHWDVDPDLIRPLVPPELELDTADGRAWVGVIPFRMEGVTLFGMPDLPFFSRFHELNVRTYVKRDGKPGVYFLSLDANNRLAVRIARAWFKLPYYDAVMGSMRDGERYAYKSRRTHRNGGHAVFDAVWEVQGPRKPEALDLWLCERYALYVVRNGKVLRGDVHHHPWELHELGIEIYENTMTAPLGFATPGMPSHAMFSPGVDTVVWQLATS